MNKNNYGFKFNNILFEKNKVIKTFKNMYGKQKINNEIDFYIYILNNNIEFPMPKLIEKGDGLLIIEYVEKSTTLTYILNNSNLFEYLNKIKKRLNNIHSVKIGVSSNDIKNDIVDETYNKAINRFNEFEWSKNELYNSIQSVNNIKVKNIYHYCEKIKQNVIKYFHSRDYYNLIHGDTHLGNILVNDDNELYFIDPRGYFGNSKLFGLYEYDYAKLLFGLSGYSLFDNMTIDKLNVENNNITIDFLKQYEYIFENSFFDKGTILLCLSIWLANNSCFSDINKKITSLMIAYYYCEKYMDI